MRGRFWLTPGPVLDDGGNSMRRLLVSVSALGLAAPLLGAVPAAAAPVPTFFAPVEIRSVGAQPAAVAIGDVTGDGRPDVLMTTNNTSHPDSDKVLVFAQNAAGGLGAPVSYQTRMSFFDHDGRGLALLDNDGDGRLDVALGTLAGVEILRQTDAGTLVSQGVLPGSPQAGQIMAADVDADGDTDLVTSTNALAGNARAGIRLLAREPGGSYTLSTVSTDETEGLGVGDLDGDAQAEIVGWNIRSLYIMDRTGTGWSRRLPPESGKGANGVEVADVTNDGRDDIIATRGGNYLPNVAVFPQSATGTIGAPAGYLTKDIPEPVRAADLDNNGRADLVLAHGGWYTMSTLLQISNGMAPPVEEPLPYASSYNAQGLAAGDISGDGKADVVIADYNHGLLVLRNALPI